MPDIGTLITDIYQTLGNRDGVELVIDEWVHHGANMAQHILQSVSKDTRDHRDKAVIYASEIGKPCHRQIYYKLYHPAEAESVPPWTKYKFLYGALIEESVIALAKAAGHKVEFEQQSVQLTLSNGWVVKGRTDCVIDGHVVDVKSMSPFSFASVKEDGLTDATDKFGYRAQTDFYRYMLHPNKTPYILAVDKVNGHMQLAESIKWVHVDDMRNDLIALTDEMSSMVPPSRRYLPLAEGAKGNLKLCVECSYCDFKHKCWPGLRGFAYAKGPVWLTKVVEEPKVPEIPKHESQTY